MSPRAVIIRAHEAPSSNRGTGVRTVYLVTVSAGADQFVTGITELAPEAFLPLHSHNCQESVVVLDGEASFEADGVLVTMFPNDTTLVPSGLVHRFVNNGTSTMRILWIYGSASPTRTIAATGETFAIGSDGH
jgi:putative monooxygenase